MVIVLTGVPGTGKNTIAKELEKEGYQWISINKLVDEKHLWDKKEQKTKTKIVNLKKLKRELDKLIKKVKKEKGKRKIIIEGHLACEMPLDCDICIVLRTNPKVLERRLKRRGYTKKKIDDNLMCEKLDYCTQLSIKNLSIISRIPKISRISRTPKTKSKCKIYEIDNSTTKLKAMKAINMILKGKGNKYKEGWIDWSKYL